MKESKHIYSLILFAALAALGHSSVNSGWNSAFDKTSFHSAKATFHKSGLWAKGYWYDFRPTNYEEEIITKAAEYAQEAYAAPSSISSLKGFTKFAVGVGSFGFTGVYTTSHGKNIGIVSFRGSTTTEDWMDDADARWQDDQYYGFYKRIRDSYPVWLAQLQNLKRTYGFKDILFTGHSLGSAESSIAAVWTGERKSSNGLNDCYLHVVNFASPRPGGFDFQRRFRNHVVYSRRIVNPGDGVTNLPLEAMGYTHVDNGLLFYAAWGGINLIQYDITQARGGLSHSVYAEALAGGTAGTVFRHGTHHHSMLLYLSRVKETFRRNK